MKHIAIVGRPNVGKSALFNRLVGRNISIVHDEAGVTRDRITSICKMGSAPFELTDTGGIGAEPDPDFAEDTHFAAEVAIAAADLLLFVVDGPMGVTPLDEGLAARLRKAGKETVLVVNKIDNDRQESLVSDFTRLGFENAVAVSAAHGREMHRIIDRIEEKLDLGDGDEGEEAGAVAKIAVVGRPNVGKSSLVNAVLNDVRTIVSDIPGTTRDAIDIPYAYNGKNYVLVDTAGIRHRSKHDTSVEVFSVMRSENAIGRADLCILVVDASQGVTMQEKKIAGLIQKAGKAAIIVLNKWDLVKPPEGMSEREYLRERLEEIQAGLFFLKFAPVVILSAKERENLPRLFNMVEKVRQHAARKIGTGELNRILAQAVDRQSPPIRGNRRLKILYATQLSSPGHRPFGRVELLLFVNDPLKLSDSYESYLGACIRKYREYPGLPIYFKMRGRKSRKRNAD